MRSILRKWRIGWREILILLGEFRLPLFIFLGAILGLGLAYDYASRLVGEPLDSLPESIYLMLTLAFLQGNGEFPHRPVLQVFYFLMPVIGLVCLALGLADFGVMVFNRRARSKEWEMAVASTLNKHAILVGLGHLGFRVVQQLHRMGTRLAVIELNHSAETFAAVQGLGIPVIEGDATRQDLLEAAGIERARTIVLCTQNDARNLQVAVKARSLNPGIQVVIRIFDDDFAQALHKQFGFIALSATGMAAPAFAAAAAGADVTRPITVEGQLLSLARLGVTGGAGLDGLEVGMVEQKYDLSVVLLKHEDESDMHPGASRTLAPGDVLVVLGGPDQLNRFIHDND